VGSGLVAGRLCRVETRSMGKKRIRHHSKSGGNYNRIRRMRSQLRVISNIGLIIGQCVLLFVSRDVGLIVLICSSLLSVPFFYNERMWDVLVLMAFMFVVNLTGLFLQ
jgi:hypothetical protein